MPFPRGEPGLAAVDLGSNSFHLVVAQLRHGEPHIVDRLRERVALAMGLDERRTLTPATVERALACLERFGQRLRDLPPENVRAVGTSALRQARNGEEFLGAAEQALGHRIETISGTEEARLVYLGVAHDLADDEGRRLVVDIGGGSTECILGEKFEALSVHSLHMGCVSYSLRFFPEGKVSAAAFERAELEARLELRGIERPFRSLGWESCVGSSGTILAVDDILREAGWRERGITLKGLRRLRKALVGAGDAHAVQLPGLALDRRGVLPGGLAILIAVFEAFDIERMGASQGALREGLLYDLVGRIRHEDVRDRTIRRMMELYHLDAQHASRVERSALGLFDQLAGEWKLDPERDRQLLSWAARLHEIGLSIAHSGHHRHGAYIVAHSVLPGFTRRGQQLLAALIQLHRRKIAGERVAHMVQPIDARLVLRLAVLLRLGVLLNRSRATLPVPRILAEARKNVLELRFDPEWFERHPLTRADLLQESAQLAAIDVELRLATLPPAPSVPEPD